MLSVPSRTSSSEQPVYNGSCVEPCGLGVVAREEEIKGEGYFVFIFILNMKGFNVITASFWLKENRMSVPNGTWRIYGMVLKPRS